MSKTIGLIGPPCSGKSTVAAALVQTRAATWLDADEIAKSMLDRPEIRDRLVETFGRSILVDDQISRPALASLVFGRDESSARRLKQLESIVHPPTHAELHRRRDAAIADGAAIILLDIPLLLESGWRAHCDEIWCLRVPEAKQRELVAARGWTWDQWQRRAAKQIPQSTKESIASRIVVNDGMMEDLTRQITNELPPTAT